MNYFFQRRNKKNVELSAFFFISNVISELVYWGAVSLLYIEYVKWQNLSKQIAEFEALIAEFETLNVRHSLNQFELIPGTIITIIWIVFNILLYPYVFDALVRFAARFLGRSGLFRNIVKNTITIYQAEMDRGDIYTHHAIQYNSYGYPIGIIPQYDLARTRAFSKAKEHVYYRLGIIAALIILFIFLLLVGWMVSAVIGWFFAYRFNRMTEK